MALQEDGKIFDVGWVGEEELLEVVLGTAPAPFVPFDDEDADADAAIDDDDATVDTFEFVIIFLSFLNNLTKK